MQLTRFTDYALRTLMYLARQPDKHATVTVRELADYYHISRDHLVKIVHKLALNGLVETVKGRGGGIRLACEPATINLGDVVRKMESNFNLVECFDKSGCCVIEEWCGLSSVLNQALVAFTDVLDSYTLEDVVRGTPSSQHTPIVRTDKLLS